MFIYAFTFASQETKQSIKKCLSNFLTELTYPWVCLYCDTPASFTVLEKNYKEKLGVSQLLVSAEMGSGLVMSQSEIGFTLPSLLKITPTCCSTGAHPFLQ